MIIGRRKFFSFFGTGVAMLAAPGLFVPKKEIEVVTATEFSWLSIAATTPEEFLEAMKAGAFNISAVYALAE